MYEYNLYNGENFITFYMVEVNEDRQIVTVVISNLGRITQDTYELLGDEDNRYFEYGMFYENKIYLNDFEEAI